MSELERYPQVPAGPARAHRPVGKVMKAVLIVAAVAAAVLLLYMALFIGIFVMAS
ncbi:hypothetical protein HRW23_34580 [Streptomyces lunaelactis]|uniref:hypothetical protein n=1 Tax=Streptomyces lunaelactis TaxID=1535768 RepID=UPI00131F21FB|nr:hypothetical protein [Streptomyces lunaelactis]NUK07830.1 hypothetical protein [Streptomyces lunaelactis]NUK24044.1 hypothetical protein [Streptomyces lunaelactis]NUK34141.1 hypothetical protein [Streptomyces lunaelactis]NUK40574.1 hypothetical protein [Streptomyces lunaelactis]NUK52296.1 hypothetical protein [Streptomyces lunaelactis]